jgi:hypothetical protein
MTNFDPIDNTDDDELAVNQSLDVLFEEASTPTKKKHTNEISGFNDNLLSFISPSSKQLHQDIAGNSPANLCHYTKETLRESRKHMLESIQYILDYGKVDVNPKAAKKIDDLEKYVQKSKLEIQKLLLLEKVKSPQKGRIEFAAFNNKKQKPEPRLKGPAG